MIFYSSEWNDIPFSEKSIFCMKFGPKFVMRSRLSFGEYWVQSWPQWFILGFRKKLLECFPKERHDSRAIFQTFDTHCGKTCKWVTIFREWILLAVRLFDNFYRIWWAACQRTVPGISNFWWLTILYQAFQISGDWQLFLRDVMLDVCISRPFILKWENCQCQSRRGAGVKLF